MCLISRGREFHAEGATWENERCPNVLVFMCGMRRVRVSEEEWSCLDGERERYEEDQTEKEGLYQRKMSQGNTQDTPGTQQRCY